MADPPLTSDCSAEQRSASEEYQKTASESSPTALPLSQPLSEALPQANSSFFARPYLAPFHDNHFVAIIPCPEPLPLMAGNFAAVVFMCEQSTYSKYHLVESTGDVSNKSSADLLGFNGTGGPDARHAATQAAGRSSLPAGKIYLECDSVSTSQSGFFVTPDTVPSTPPGIELKKQYYFVTAAHFLDTFEKVRRPSTEVIWHLKSDYHSAYISDQTRSTEPDKHTDYPAQLIHLFREDDIAIFKVGDLKIRREDQDVYLQPKHSVELAQLHSISELPRNDYPRLNTIFVAGYNGQDRLMSDTNTYGIPRHLRTRARPLDMHPSVYDLLLDAAEQRAAVSGKKIPSRPPFDLIYEPDRRAMAVGKIVEPVEPIQTLSQPSSSASSRVYTRDIYTSASGFWGVSGGMIGMLDPTNIAAPAKVIGIFRGFQSWDSEYNIFGAFTPRGIEEIRKIVVNPGHVDVMTSA